MRQTPVLIHRWFPRGADWAYGPGVSQDQLRRCLGVLAAELNGPPGPIGPMVVAADPPFVVVGDRRDDHRPGQTRPTPMVRLAVLDGLPDWGSTPPLLAALEAVDAEGPGVNDGLHVSWEGRTAPLPGSPATKAAAATEPARRNLLTTLAVAVGCLTLGTAIGLLAPRKPAAPAPQPLDPPRTRATAAPEARPAPAAPPATVQARAGEAKPDAILAALMQVVRAEDLGTLEDLGRKQYRDPYAWSIERSEEHLSLDAIQAAVRLPTPEALSRMGELVGQEGSPPRVTPSLKPLLLGEIHARYLEAFQGWSYDLRAGTKEDPEPLRKLAADYLAFAGRNGTDGSSKLVSYAEAVVRWVAGLQKPLQFAVTLFDSPAGAASQVSFWFHDKNREVVTSEGKWNSEDPITSRVQLMRGVWRSGMGVTVSLLQWDNRDRQSGYGGRRDWPFGQPTCDVVLERRAGQGGPSVTVRLECKTLSMPALPDARDVLPQFREAMP